ncbi:MAG: sterol desaturase family protein [Verrucomicrobiota bacterium]
MKDVLLKITESSNWVVIFTLLILLVWEGYAPYFSFFRQKMKKRALHAARNFTLTVMNAIMTSLMFIWIWNWAADFTTVHQFGLMNQFALPAWGKALGVVLLFDIWTYWWHRFSHVVPFLWRFHRVHHSDPQMDVTTSNRFHIGEIFISNVIRIPLIMLFGAEFWHIALFSALMFPVVQFQHANIGLTPTLDRLLRIVFVTPHMHKVHHSRYYKETNSNYTSMFSIWDRLFGSFRLSKDLSKIQLGLNHFDSDKKQSIGGMLATPLGKNHTLPKNENNTELEP